MIRRPGSETKENRIMEDKGRNNERFSGKPVMRNKMFKTEGGGGGGVKEGGGRSGRGCRRGE